MKALSPIRICGKPYVLAIGIGTFPAGMGFRRAWEDGEAVVFPTQPAPGDSTLPEA